MSEQTIEFDQPDINDDLRAYVRFHGANDVIDAVLAVAAEIYGDTETAVTKCHESFLRRASVLRQPPGRTGGAR